ncbi:RNA-guided endonuclease TnpB family protein [Nocardia miyunensis]|uniref:RNA-guided endonuclease TnpB family protein n=1 Tax=Nocardia miyunensis TaxID=282684 RepID=UPI00082A0223|nr:RNA-guided endonuclease TnpB family protein [Nocardia miyunensis]
MDEVVRYTYRLRPGRTAEAVLLAEWGRCRWLWNEAVHQYEGRGRPKVKSRKRSLPSLAYTRRGFSLRDGRLVLAKGVRGEGGIGMDWGVSTTATTTDPAFDLPYLGHRQRCAAELAKAQRKMARRHRKGGPQSRGYGAAKRQAARLAKKAARQTVHDSRVWAKRVVDRHEVIAVEDFKPVFLAKSTMAGKAADAAIGAAKRELIERATRAGRTVVVVRPAYTTMTCSQCFARTKRLERNFRCEGCGFAASRDRNAARVVLAVAERGHVGVEDVRQSDHLLRVGGSVAV